MRTGQWRLLTLTLKTSTEALQESVNSLYRGFTRLRQQPWWKAKVEAGIAVLEVTRNAATGGWHPHLHVLIRGDYVPQKLVAMTWEAITGTSRIVDVRRVKSLQNASRYVTKYLSKTGDDSLYADGAALQELIMATRRRRTVVTFGKVYGVKAADHANDSEWESYGSVDWLLSQQHRDEALKAAVLAAVMSLEAGDGNEFEHVRAPPLHVQKVRDLTHQHLLW